MVTFVLGVAAEIHAIREEARKEAAERAKLLDQKQQLGRIEAEMKASTRPLLPIAMFYTFRHSITAEAVDHVFVGVPGFKSVKSNRFLKPVGSVRLGGPLRYNSITLSAAESHCILKGEELAKSIDSHGTSAVRQPDTTTVEFFFHTNGEPPGDPAIQLEKTFTTGKPDEVGILPKAISVFP